MIGLTMLSITSTTYAQNLLENASFESVDGCLVTNNAESISAIDDWDPINTPDFFHTCFSGASFTPPAVYSGYSSPYSGNGMAGIELEPTINYREGVTIKIIDDLIADSAYCYSYWVKNTVLNGYTYETEMIDCLFGYNEPTIFDIELAIYSESNPDPTVESGDGGSEAGWHEVVGYYIALGGEDEFTISFLGNLDHTTNAPAAENRLYYFLDHASVEMCNKDSALATAPELFNLPNSFTPNGDGINDLFTINLPYLDEMTVTILNRWGNEIITYDGLNYSWDGNTPAGVPVKDGTYFYRVDSVDKDGVSETRHGFLYLGH